MELIKQAVDVFLHLDRYLAQGAALLGPGLYALLFLVVFCETGLVVTPYLPGDSLLFAVGALAAREDFPVKLPAILPLLFVAAVLGDAVNYAIGRYVGPRIFSREDSRFLDRRHLDKARLFYERYGGKTIILARFIPVIRTFAPFVAGIGRMEYRRFALFNVLGGAAWTSCFLLAGWRFAELPAVKQHFHYVILGIIVVSILPAVVEWLRAGRQAAGDGRESSQRVSRSKSAIDS